MLNRGRDDHPYRWAVSAHDNQELAALLRAQHPDEREPSAQAPVVFLLSGDAELSDDTWTGLRSAFPNSPLPTPAPRAQRTPRTIRTPPHPAPGCSPGSTRRTDSRAPSA